MTRASADVFARRPDTDWEMFCRGRRDDGPAWVDATPQPTETGSETRGGSDWLTEPGENAAVPLSPDDGDAGGRGDSISPPADGLSAAPFVRHFQAKVVGISYPNPDGTSRIEAVRGLRVRELVRLDHRPDNPVDPNAVAVVRPTDGRQLGYLRAAVAADVVAAARRGARYLALVHEVTGADPLAGLSAGGQVGAVLLVLVLERGATKAMARRYLLDLMNNPGR